jgi:hypothetical protein
MTGGAPGAAGPNAVLRQWQRLSALPGGRWLFSRAVQHKAPYFRTAAPRVEELRPDYARLVMRKRRRVENHIGTVHVIAICNLLEMAMGVLAEASVPGHLRWIPKGMTVRYTAKAGTDITGVAEVAPGAWAPGELAVTVRALDAAGAVVVDGVITLWVSARK